MEKTTLVGTVAVVFASLSASTLAADPNLGRNIAANCAACHGTNGVSQGQIPGLAGLEQGYIVEQMQAFKAGQRQATVMHQIAKGYSDEQTAAVAEYFSRQER